MRARKLAVVAMVLALVALTPAAADAKRVKSRVFLFPFGIIEPSGTITYLFEGSVGVQGRHFECADHRRVRVFRDEPAGDDTLIGSDRTTLFGTFLAAQVTDLDEVPGDYYAKLHKKKVKTKSRTLRCTGDRSRTVTVYPPDIG
jgi:hypothetical protein